LKVLISVGLRVFGVGVGLYVFVESVAPLNPLNPLKPVEPPLCFTCLPCLLCKEEPYAFASSVGCLVGCNDFSSVGDKVLGVGVGFSVTMYSINFLLDCCDSNDLNEESILSAPLLYTK